MSTPDTATFTRSQQDIVDRITAVANDDFFGFRISVLIDLLTFESATAAGLLSAETTTQMWSDAGAGPRTDEELRVVAVDYLTFAFGKARDHRGMSAARSVGKLTEWAWLLGHGDLATEMQADGAYKQYGVPALLLFARHFNLPVPDGEDLARMGRGEPCRPDCAEGCSR